MSSSPPPLTKCSLRRFFISNVNLSSSWMIYKLIAQLNWFAFGFLFASGVTTSCYVNMQIQNTSQSKIMRGSDDDNIILIIWKKSTWNVRSRMFSSKKVTFSRWWMICYCEFSKNSCPIFTFPSVILSIRSKQSPESFLSNLFHLRMCTVATLSSFKELGNLQPFAVSFLSVRRARILGLS